MAFACIENFDSYTAASDIVGQSGGSGWSGAWYHINAGGVGTVVTTHADTSPNSVTVAVNSVSRVFTTGVTNGILQFAVYVPTGGEDGMTLGRSSDNGTTLYVHFVSGVVKTNLNGTGGEMTVASISADAWHTIGIELDSAGHSLKYKLYVDGTSYDNSGSWWDLQLGEQTISQLTLSYTRGGTPAFYDSIGPPPVVTPKANAMLMMGI